MNIVLILDSNILALFPGVAYGPGSCSYCTGLSHIGRYPRRSL